MHALISERATGRLPAQHLEGVSPSSTPLTAASRARPLPSNNRDIDDCDIALRNATYQHYAAHARVPSVGAIAVETGASDEDVIEGWRRLHDEHALVLDGDALRMLNPFSMVRTSHRVTTRGRFWYANCAWDAFGVCSALRTPGRIETRCPDCSAALVIDTDDDTAATRALVFHSLVPARRWWDDIVFT